MINYSRYAIYYAPEAGTALADFGATWLKGAARPDNRPSVTMALPVLMSELSETLRKYGLHGTLKPPFELYGEQCGEDLEAAVQQMARQQSPFVIPAITPMDHSPEQAALGARCIGELDGFRAPPTHADLARHCAAKLTAPQKRNLARWGYPYVIDEFRFHLTLTGRLAPEVGTAVLAYLQGALAQVLAQPLPVREICLFGEKQGENFHILKRFALAG
jgi:hypothetical protein